MAPSVVNHTLMYEWTLDRLKLLEARNLMADMPQGIPDSLRRKLTSVSVNECNSNGEPLLVSLVKYGTDESTMIKYLTLLIADGADINTRDEKESRNALMYSCSQERCLVADMLLNQVNINLMMQDRLGNSALMYACVKGLETVVNAIVDRLCRNFGIGCLMLKNCMGNTAEDLAIINRHHRCARMVQSQRLHMLSCMNKQLQEVDYNKSEGRCWKAFTAVYKCLEKWRPRRRRNSDCSKKFIAPNNILKRKNSF